MKSDINPFDSQVRKACMAQGQYISLPGDEAVPQRARDPGDDEARRGLPEERHPRVRVDSEHEQGRRYERPIHSGAH